MKKSKAMKSLERDAKNVEANAREYDEHVSDDMDGFEHRMRADLSKAKNKMNNTGRNTATHVKQAGTKAKNHLDNRKK